MRKLDLWIVVMLALAAPVLRADEIWIGSGGAGAIQIPNARITRVEGGMMYFTANDRESSRELDKVQRIALEGEPALNAAEEAFAGSRWDDAVDGYQKTLRSTTRPWLKDWAAARLIEAANRSGRFDAAVSAYVAMLLKDPAAADGLKPAMPNQRSTYLDSAVNEVNATLNTRNLTDPQRRALLTFLMDLHRARGDRDAEQRVAAQLDESLARDPNNPAAAEALARRRLVAARAALDAKDFQKAIAEINASRDQFVERHDQAEALFVLAEARYGLAGSGNSPDALKDAALMYMRVVAHFKHSPERPYVAPSLLKTGMIHEQLDEPQAAAALYQQVVQDFGGEPAAELARQRLQQLGPPTGAGRSTTGNQPTTGN